MFQLDKIPCLNVSLESLISMVLKALSTTGSYESLACLPITITLLHLKEMFK